MQRFKPELNLDQAMPASSAPMATVAPLQLRVIGTQRHGHIVEIAANRCTIGSASDCTVRLRAAGVRPIHCVILRGRDGLVCRSLSSDTLLNGRAFREQSLRTGDRLRLGPIEFEVLGESNPPISQPNETQLGEKMGTEPQSAPFSVQIPPVAPAPPEIPIWTNAESGRPSDILTRLQRLEQQVLESPAADLVNEPLSDEQDIEAPAPDTFVAETPTTPPADAIARSDSAPSDIAPSDIAPSDVAPSDVAPPADAIAPSESTDTTASVLNEELSARTAELTATTAELTSLQQVLNDRAAEWEQARQSMNVELDAMRLECDRQQREMADRGEAFKAEIAQLTSELQSERQSLEVARRTWSTDCDTLEDQRRSLSQLNYDVEQRSRAEYIKYDMDRENWLTERQGLEQLLGDFRHRNEELEQEAKLLTEQYHQIAGKLEQLEARMAALTQTSEPESTQKAEEREVDAGTPQANLWLAGAAHPLQPRSELTWMAQQFAATQQPESISESPAVNDVASTLTNDGPATVTPIRSEGSVLSEPFVRVAFLPSSLAPSDAESNEQLIAEPTSYETQSRTTEVESVQNVDQPAAEQSAPSNSSAPQFSVRFLAQLPAELVESLPKVAAGLPTDVVAGLPTVPLAPTAGLEENRRPSVDQVSGSGDHATTEVDQVPWSGEVEQAAWSGDHATTESGEHATTGSLETGTDDPDVFNRLQRAGIWRDPETAAVDSTMQAETSAFESLTSPYVEEVVEVTPDEQPGAAAPVVTPNVEVEDSIEMYMKRLLERMRGADGTTDEPPTYVFPVEETSADGELEAAEALNQSSEEIEQAPIEEKEYVPRSQAPESNRNLNAMRELANDSRQRNMLSHAHRTWSAESAGKILSAFAGFTVAFASFFLRDIHPKFAIVGFMGGIGAGIVCLWQALSLRRRLFDSLKLDIDYRSNDRQQSTEDTSTDVVENDQQADQLPFG